MGKRPFEEDVEGEWSADEAHQLTELDLYSPRAIERFRALIAEGEASGPSQPWDPEAIFARITDPSRPR